MCLLDNGTQLNFMTPAYAIKRGLNVMSLDHLDEESGKALPPINCLGGGFVKPTGFVIMNVQVPCVKGYNEDCEGLKPPLESFSWIDHAVIVMSNNY